MAMPAAPAAAVAQKGTPVAIRELSSEYDYDELAAATLQWHASRRLGTGSFGSVYRAELKDGSELAVRCLDSRRGQAPSAAAFQEEVQVLAKLRHPNLATLLGWSKKDAQRYLVFEFLTGTSVAQRLANSRLPGGAQPFPWHQRLSACSDAAMGLSRMHSLKVLHRCVKSSHILLDQQGAAKLTDVGLSCTSSGNAFSPGYTCPVFQQSGQHTEGSDIYAFGIILLELVTGLAPVAPDPQRPNVLICPLASTVAPGQPEAATRCAQNVDASAGWTTQLSGELAALALRCTDGQDEARPRMAEVNGVLRGLLERFPRPTVTVVSGGSQPAPQSAAQTSVPASVGATNSIPLFLECVKAASVNAEKLPPEQRRIPLFQGGSSSSSSVGRIHQADIFEVWLPDEPLRNCVSRTAFDVVRGQGSEGLSLILRGTNPLSVDKRLAAQGVPVPLQIGSEIAFNYSSPAQQEPFLLLRLQTQTGTSSSSPGVVAGVGVTGSPAVASTPRPGSEAQVTPSLSEKCPWRLVCLHAEGFGGDRLQTLPQTSRQLDIPVGTLLLGRERQPAFFEALLAGAPQLLTFISRTHLEFVVQQDSANVSATNVSPNPVYVDREPLAKGKVCSLRQDQVLSFARPEGPEGNVRHIHFLVFQLQLLQSVAKDALGRERRLTTPAPEMPKASPEAQRLAAASPALQEATAPVPSVVPAVPAVPAAEARVTAPVPAAAAAPVAGPSSAPAPVAALSPAAAPAAAPVVAAASSPMPVAAPAPVPVAAPAAAAAPAVAPAAAPAPQPQVQPQPQPSLAVAAGPVPGTPSSPTATPLSPRPVVQQQQQAPAVNVPSTIPGSSSTAQTSSPQPVNAQLPLPAVPATTPAAGPPAAASLPVSASPVTLPLAAGMPGGSSPSTARSSDDMTSVTVECPRSIPLGTTEAAAPAVHPAPMGSVLGRDQTPQDVAQVTAPPVQPSPAAPMGSMLERELAPPDFQQATPRSAQAVQAAPPLGSTLGREPAPQVMAQAAQAAPPLGSTLGREPAPQTVAQDFHPPPRLPSQPADTWRVEVLLELSGEGVLDVPMDQRRIGPACLTSGPLNVGRRHQTELLKRVIKRDCFQFLSRDHFRISYDSGSFWLHVLTPNPVWIFRGSEELLELACDDVSALHPGDIIALGTGDEGNYTTAEDARRRLSWRFRVPGADASPAASASPRSDSCCGEPSSPGGPGPRLSMGPWSERSSVLLSSRPQSQQSAAQQEVATKGGLGAPSSIHPAPTLGGGLESQPPCFEGGWATPPSSPRPVPTLGGSLDGLPSSFATESPRAPRGGGGGSVSSPRPAPTLGGGLDSLPSTFSQAEAPRGTASGDEYGSGARLPPSFGGPQSDSRWSSVPRPPGREREERPSEFCSPVPRLLGSCGMEAAPKNKGERTWDMPSLAEESSGPDLNSSDALLPRFGALLEGALEDSPPNFGGSSPTFSPSPRGHLEDSPPPSFGGALRGHSPGRGALGGGLSPSSGALGGLGSFPQPRSGFEGHDNTEGFFGRRGSGSARGWGDQRAARGALGYTR